MATTNLVYDLPLDIQENIFKMKSKLDFQETIDFIKNGGLITLRNLNIGYKLFLVLSEEDDVYDPSQKVRYNGIIIGEYVVSISA